MGFPGYAGSILYIDLTKSNVRTELLDEAMARTYLGGAGINNRLAYDLIPPDAEALSPENAIIIGTGPFNGTIIPGSSETMIIYKSPLNGSFPHSNGGGRFSHFLKSSGYDHLVVTGRSGEPVYVKIHDEVVEFCDAHDLWGKDIFETTDELRRRHEPCSIIPIGQAGENRIPISVTFIDKGGTVGSGGLCAVMGYKNLKAIVVMQGSKGVEIADKRRLLRCVDEILSRVRNYHLRDEMMLGGTMTMSRNWIGSGELARMATELVPYPREAKEMLSEIYEIHKASRRKIACITCPMGDKDRLDLLGSGIRSYATALFSAESLMTFSQAYGHCTGSSAMDRYTNAVRYMDMVNRYGIDKAYGFYGVIDFVVTLYERGIITKEDTGGFELNREFDALLKLVEMTARREGFGDILAEGIVGAARRIGKGAENSLNHVVKGQCVASDPRIGGMGPMQFAQLVHPGRAFGVAAAMGAVTYSPGGELKELRRQAARCGVSPEAMERIFTEHSFNVARLTKHGEDFFNLFNMLGQCHRLYISRFYSMDILAELYSSVTGVDVTTGDLKLASERSWDLWKMINHRVGYDRQDDEPPDVWFEPLKGPDEEYHLMDYYKTKQLFKEDVNGLLDDYYDERGWDIAKGLPFERRI